jgi:hypothetical protein
MSVIMGMRIAADPQRVEQALNSDPDRLTKISQRARDAGCMHHRFLANADGGEVLVLDEWPDADSFMQFFQNSPDIGEMMQEAGVTERPTPVFWRDLDTSDKF